jgi:anti-sigma factor RsiW
MMHSHVQKQLLLYLDGNLPEEKRQYIREHLSVCTVCAQQHDLLVSVWRSESRREKLQPSPFLWTRLQTRIKEYEQTPSFVRGMKEALRGIMVRPLSIPVAIAAIFAGIYLGTPRDPQRYEHPQSINRAAGSADDLGLDHFDVIPPTALGSTLVNVSHTQK